MSFDAALSQLTELAAEIQDQPIDRLLLRSDKKGHLSFEKKTFLGTISRFFTVTLFRSHAYNFDENLEKIAALMSIVNENKRAVKEDDKAKITELSCQLSTLADRVAKSRKKASQWRIWSKKDPLLFDKKINKLKKALLFDPKPNHTKFATASLFSQQHKEVVAKAKNALQDTKSIKSHDLVSLANRCVSLFEIETAFTLYQAAVLKDRKVLNTFVELGLFLRKFDDIEKTLDKLRETRSSEREIKLIRNRLAEFKKFGAGEKTEYTNKEKTTGFTAGEIQMLVLYAEAHKKNAAVLRQNSQKMRDFISYASGNKDFNERLRTQVALMDDASSTLTDPELKDAITNFSVISYKADPKLWQKNLIAVEHVEMVTKLYDINQRLEKNKILVSKLKSALAQVKTSMFKSREQTTAPTRWQLETQLQTVKAQTEKITSLQAEIHNDEIIRNKLTQEVQEIQDAFPTLFSGDPKKIQLWELRQIQSLTHFALHQFHKVINQAAELSHNPLFAAQYSLLDRVKDSARTNPKYGIADWLRNQCEETSEYLSGDLSFINALKEKKVTGKKIETVMDYMASLLYPFGHMALFDNDQGYLAFSHQRLEFAHESLDLSEYLYYDTYRIDMAKIINPEAIGAYKEILKKRGVTIETDLQTTGLSEETYILQKLEEEFADATSRVLKGADMPDVKKLQGLDPPDEAFSSLESLEMWIDEVNLARAEKDKITVYEALEYAEDFFVKSPQLYEIVVKLHVDNLKKLYRNIKNDSNIQLRAFLNSWRYIARLPGSKVPLNPHELNQVQEICCSQFAFLKLFEALHELQNSLRRESGNEVVEFIRIPLLTKDEFECATPEFIMKKYQNILKPVMQPTILRKIVDCPDTFFNPIPIEKTISYMIKRMLGVYTT